MAEFPRWVFGGTRILYSWRLTSDANSRETRVMRPEGTDQTRWPVYLPRTDGISPDSREFVYAGVAEGDSLVVLMCGGSTTWLGRASVN